MLGREVRRVDAPARKRDLAGMAAQARRALGQYDSGLVAAVHHWHKHGGIAQARLQDEVLQVRVQPVVAVIVRREVRVLRGGATAELRGGKERSGCSLGGHRAAASSTSTGIIGKTAPRERTANMRRPSSSTSS